MNLMSASSLVFSGERVLSALYQMNNSLKKKEHIFSAVQIGPKRGEFGSIAPGFKEDYCDE